MGGYKFQQVRDQNYDLMICLGVSPFAAHCWVIPKKDLLRLWKIDHKIKSQHGGTRGADTAWIDVDPQHVPRWLAKYGGSLSEGIKVLSKLTGFVIKTVDEELSDNGSADMGR